MESGAIDLNGPLKWILILAAVGGFVHLTYRVVSKTRKERAEKRIGSSLQAVPVIYAPSQTKALFEGIDAAELFITSGAHFTDDEIPDNAFTLDDVADIAVVPTTAAGQKCDRCYQFLEEVGTVTEHPNACKRCADAADNFQPLPDPA